MCSNKYNPPKEATFLGTVFFCLPANAANPRGAELFLNFILQPEIAAQIVNESYYPMAVDGMDEFIIPEILQNPVIFPDNAQMQNAEIILPTHKSRKPAYDDVWSSFIGGNPWYLEKITVHAAF